MGINILNSNAGSALPDPEVTRTDNVDIGEEGASDNETEMVNDPWGDPINVQDDD